MDEARVNPTMAWLSPGQRCDVPQGALMACVTCFDNKEESKSTRKDTKAHGVQQKFSWVVGYYMLLIEN